MTPRQSHGENQGCALSNQSLALRLFIMKNINPYVIGQEASARGISDTLMLGTRKKIIDGKPVSVAVLYSRSGQENMFERFKLFFLGDLLQYKAKQKIVDCLKKNATGNQAALDFLQEINQSKKGVSASKLIEVVVQAKLSGVDLLKGIEVTHQANSLRGAETISEAYLMGVTETLLRSHSGVNAATEGLTKLLLKPRNAQVSALTSTEKNNLQFFKEILSRQTVLSEKMRDGIIQRIDQLLGTGIPKPAQSSSPLPKQTHIREKPVPAEPEQAKNHAHIHHAVASKPGKDDQERPFVDIPLDN